MHKRSFTLMEMLLVIIILGALSGLALPRFMKFMEIQKARTAINQLRLIISGLEYLRQNRIPCPDECLSAWCDITLYNSQLGLDIHNSDFQYFLLCRSDLTEWDLESIRTPDPSFGEYSLSHAPLIDPDAIRCLGEGCSFIGSCQGCNLEF